jgi:hypothetical protein
MKVLSLSSLQRTAARRPAGYLEDVLSHATVEGDTVTMQRESYLSLVRKYRAPVSAKKAAAPQARAASFGPGTELKALLKRVGIVANPGCSCNLRARAMDEMEAKEPGWCAANIDTIVGWLREEAGKRGLPFLDLPGRLLVKRAIANARRKEAAANAQRPPHHDRRQEMAPPVHKVDG